MKRTVDGELSGFTKSSTGDVLGDARVVALVAESNLTDDEVAFVRYDHVDVCPGVHPLAVF